MWWEAVKQIIGHRKMEVRMLELELAHSGATSDLSGIIMQTSF